MDAYQSFLLLQMILLSGSESGTGGGGFHAGLGGGSFSPLLF